jgi:PPK2 family polyphosphate:nucleotide phosphotransferase
MTDLRGKLRAGPGFHLAAVDPAATPGAPGGKKKTAAALEGMASELADLQERLYAEETRRVVLVLQGMDTSGKGGVIKHVVGQVDPLGVEIASFKQPTEQERAHHFLWRIRRALPEPGKVGVFDRSHYEDVLIVRVHELAEWEGRYDEINRFEAKAADDGVTWVKVCLHISPDKQRDRLLRRLDRPDKHWKYNPGDVDERARWDDYMAAYADAIGRCSTDVAPWYVVPSNRKWYRNWAVGQLLLETLRELDPAYPAPDFDVDAEKRRVAKS